MPQIKNHGVRIHYEVTGQGRPLVLLHGAALDGSVWSHAGYVRDLERDHRLVIMDVRGHGRSDKPHESEAYRGEVVTNDVLAVVDAEGIDRFAVWGHSAGGWVAWITASLAPQRVAAMVSTGSADPSPETEEGWAEFDQGFLEPVRRGGMPALIEVAEGWERGPLPTWLKPLMLRADPEVFLASNSSELLDEEDPIPPLEVFPVPVLLIVGEYEDEEGAAARVAATVPRGESLVLSGLGHCRAFDRSDLVLPTARAFLDRWFA